MPNVRTMSFAELDKIIDAEDNKSMKKAVLVVKSVTRPLRENYEGLTEAQIRKIVNSQINAQRLAADEFIEDEVLSEIYFELGGLAENLELFLVKLFPEVPERVVE